MREENNRIRSLIEDEVDNTIHVNDASMDYLVDDMESTISLDRMLELCKFKTTKDYVANGSSFILPNGDFVSVKDNVPSKVKSRIHRDLAYQIALKVLPEVIKTRNPDSEIDFSELSEEDCRGLMARLTDAYGFCRINSGTGEREDRFYMILPPYEKKITTAQYASILKYLDWGVENGKRWVYIYIGDEDGNDYGAFSFNKITPDEIVKALRTGYNRGKVLFYESIHAANEDMNQEDKARFEKRIGTPYDTAKGIVENQVRGILEENGLDDIDITGFEFTGSYVFGTPREDSDLDVRMTYSGHEREDTLFNVLHDDDYPIMLNGITVDVNPIQDGDIDKLIDKDRTYKKGLNEGAKGKIIAYHGTSSRFDKFKMPINWFSESKAYSKEFARWLGNGKAFIYECELDPKSVLDVGSTDVPLFSLMPLLPPYKLSMPASSICSKLGVDEGEFAELADHTSAGNDIRKQYRLKLHTVIRLPQFAAMAKKAGFDAIRALEDGNVCYGMIGSENIRIMNVENLNESLGEAYKTPNKLYSINNGKATWDNDAQNFIWWDSESKSEPKYASSYKCKMSPKDFLDLTTDRGADALMNGDTFGIGGKFRDLDVDEFNREKRQPIFLIISFEESLIRTSPDFYRGRFEADVVGHEGRHRMYALMKAGVKEVDVQLKVADTMYFDRMKPYKISKLDLIGQFNRRVKVTVNNPIVMSWDSHRELNPNVENEIIEASKPGVHGACVRKSKLTESKEDRQKFIDKFGQDMLDLFTKSKDRLKNAGISTDMLWHVKNTSPEDMKNILYNLRAKVVKNDGKADMTKIQGKYNYLGSKDGYDVYEPLDTLASMNLGVGTGWCTTGRYGHAGDINFKPSYEDAKKHWDSYTSRGVRFFYFLQNGIGKWALALTSQHSDVNMFADMNTYIERCNFELYNQEDILDYSGLSEIPYDLIGAELILDKKDTINGLVISDDGKTVLRCYYKVKSAIVPEGITSIDSAAFSRCNIESVTLPNSLTIIRSFAFEFCRSLKSITIPKSVTVIDSYAFKCCDSLELVTILNDSSILLGSHLFYYTENVVVKTNNKKVMGYCDEHYTDFIPLDGAAEESIQEGGKSMADGNRKILRGASVRHSEKNAPNLNESKADQQKFIDKFGEDVFDLFAKSKDRLKNAGISTDMLWHVKNTDTDKMKSILYNLRAKVKTDAEGDVDPTKIQGEYNYIGSKDGYDVYEPLDVVASMSLGVGTGWCTTGRYGHAGDLNFKPSYEDAKDHWDEYTEDGVRFFYFLQNGIGMYALALYPYEVERQIIVGDNYYINHCDFELYNKQDYVDYDGLLEIPFDLIEDEMTAQIIVMHDGLAIGDNYEDKKTLFHCIKDLTTVTIPTDVEVIASGAFMNCRLLKSVTIPDSVKEIGDFAFAECDNLKSVVIPDSVTEIDGYIFYKCSKKLVVSTNNKLAIDYCKENGIATKPLTAAEESLQEGVKSMADGNHKILRGASVRRAEKNAPNLNESKADQQKFIDKFGKDIFDLFNKSKDRLKNAGISTDILYHVKNTSPEDMKNILNNLRAKVVRNGDDVDLTKIQGKYNYLGSKDGYDVYEPLDVVSSMSLGVGTGWCTTGRYGHAGNLNFKPDREEAEDHWKGYTSGGRRLFYFLQNGIGKYALLLYSRKNAPISGFIDKNTYIKSCNFILFDQYDKMDFSAFSKLPYDLIEKAIQKSIKFKTEYVKDGMLFSDNGKTLKKIFHGLTSVEIPDSVTEIASFAFAACSHLVSLTIPNSIKSIGYHAFDSCSSLKYITLPENITIINGSVFNDCKSLDSITIPNKVTKIDSYAFDSCINLKSIVIPDGVTEICIGAFNNCRSLKSVTIPNSVSSFGNGHFGDGPVFENCSKDLVVRTDNKAAIEYCKENGIATKPLTAVEESLQEGGKSMEDDNRGEASLAGTSIEDFDSLVSQVNNIREDIEKHDALNPKLWDERGNLKPEVREKILEIAKEFTDGLKEDGIKFDLKDIRLVGSNCSYNYTDKSDLDVHLIMDTDSLECPDDLYPLLYSAYRSLFNGKMDIDFYGIPVELYVETE